MTTSLPHAKSMVEHEDLIYASTTTRMHANFDKEKAKTIASRTNSKLKFGHFGEFNTVPASA